MPVIFHRIDGRWGAETIPDAPGFLWLGPVRFELASNGPHEQTGACFLARTEADGQWVLLARGEERLLHNGHPVTAGMRVLAHRDSLALEGREAVYFSTEEAARIEPFAGSTKPSCPRCRLEIPLGQSTVKCPRCGVFHHEMDERNCWTYAQTCALCAQPTALDTGPQWSPESL